MKLRKLPPALPHSESPEKKGETLMCTHHPDRIEASVNALSRELRWHRRAWLLLLLAGGAVALAGAAGPPAGAELRATKIVLTDPSGAVRGTLGVEADGTPALRFFDETGAERLAALVSATGSSVSVLEKDRKTAAKLMVEGGAPRVALTDRTGTDRLWVAVRLGSPVIQFLAPDGVARSGLVTMNDDTGIAFISGSTSTVPGLALYDKNRKIVWSAP